MLELGDTVEVSIGPVAHGGHCVARVDGQVVFVRHAIPDERVVARITGVGPQRRWLRADAIEVLTPSPNRVNPPCPWSGPGRCGGCDWQHVQLETQRAFKAAVIKEQFRRLASLDVDVEVEAVAGDVEGLGWRTRMRYAVDTAGHAGLRANHSHDVVPVDPCLIANQALATPSRWRDSWVPGQDFEVALDADGLVRVESLTATASTQRAQGRTFQLSGDAFWQVHPGAADVLGATVLEMAKPRPNEHVVDLYAGVGLFAALIAESLSAAGRLDAVEANAQAAADATTNLSGPSGPDGPSGTEHPAIAVHAVAVERFLGSGAVARCDVVVLDPPRRGAKSQVVAGIVGWRPTRVVYVACDPASLARDVATFAAAGYRLSAIRAFDLFPMTHHVETVALLTPA